ncbi:zinc finger protein STOP1 homolog [Phalaenopsis equestris]|uniref:zinc finger protein STOP1 homolog n=1 Tax=Phalaenopsis equestris TaxID=78828 RepID=UPI0009E5476A|nr:zinc finger protein STOP1 homolog [Phalaenopsis equestris]XP_020596286.1 zinc finger protein STOP1 homolog [Phalaenopsis equestris]
MNLNHKRVAESSPSSSRIMGDTARNLNRNLPFSPFNSAALHHDPRTAPSLPEISPPDAQSQSLCPLIHEVKKQDQSEPITCAKNHILDWDPREMLNNLSFLEQKIHQVQDIVHSIANQDGQFPNHTNELAVQQQLVTADLTCIIIQLISTAGTLLPSMKNSLISTDAMINPSGCITSTPSLCFNGNMQQKETILSQSTKASEFDELIKGLTDCGTEGDELIKCLKNSRTEVAETAVIEDQDLKDVEESVEGENLIPGSYEVFQLEKEEILAPHTHFCMICGKGFKRDANLRMHMRGHGDEYKSAAALAKPTKELNSELMPIRRYSCPFVGCKRNKDHKKFLPLKTILCVKNHYKRSHCDKKYTCSRCHSKKFSVLADLKTHEKHCGRDKWLCSCGTTFSRKDKLFGHVALFQGHTPALAMEESKTLGGLLDHGNDDEEKAIVGRSSLDDANVLDVREDGLFSLMNFDSYNFGGFDEFSRPGFNSSRGSFCFDASGSDNGAL